MNDLMYQDYFFETEKSAGVINQKFFIVICYDINDNKRRSKFSKYLEQYAIRVQRSVFESILSKHKFEELKTGIQKYIAKTDNVKIYKLTGNGDVYTWGTAFSVEDEEIIII